LLRSRRQHLHARIAATLEDRFPEVGAAQPALLAHHCTEACLIEKAVDYWLAAGRQAWARSAAAEAVALLHRGLVIASWSYGLIHDTGAILLDMNPDRRMADNLRRMIEAEGDTLGDLHLWRLGPGHLGAIVSVITKELRGPEYYRAKLARFRDLSHLTIQVEQSTGHLNVG